MITLEALHTILQRIDYPASKADIIDQVRRRGAPEEAITRLQTIPEYMYGSENTVMDALQNLE